MGDEGQHPISAAAALPVNDWKTITHVKGIPAAALEDAAGIEFAEERFLDVIEEAMPLLQRHEREVGALRGRQLLAPNMEGYAQAAAAGLYRAFTLRVTGVRTLIGYCGMALTPHLHYSRTPWAIQDVLYVAPEFRGIQAVSFIRWCDARLFEQGAMVIARHSTTAHPFHRTLERMGYVEIERTFILSRVPESGEAEDARSSDGVPEARSGR